MLRLRRFSTIIEANSAAIYLAEHGVRATVVGHHTQDIQFSYNALRRGAGGPFELMLLDPDQLDDASLILESFEQEPVELEPGWERDAERIDLARLDPEACAIRCPSCARTLPLDAAVVACPDCAEPVDIPQILFETHGPEALADALRDEEDDG